MMDLAKAEALLAACEEDLDIARDQRHLAWIESLNKRRDGLMEIISKITRRPLYEVRQNYAQPQPLLVAAE